MPLLLDGIYLLALGLLAPWLLYAALVRGKHRRGLAAKVLGWVEAAPQRPAGPTAWFHGVSVGEIHLLRTVVAAFRRRHPDWTCVISTTTDTGMAEARRCFPDLAVIDWPFDFSWAVGRALRRIQPTLVVLAEGEIWPNFLRAAKAAGVRVAVINGRLSPRSGQRYRRLRWLIRPILQRLDLIATQTAEYAEQFRLAGANPDRVYVTNSVKFDGVHGERTNAQTQELGRLLAVQPGERVWVAGSTQAPEEEIVVSIYARLAKRHPGLRLFLVPRHRERFEEVAGLLRRSGLPWVRRSALGQSADVSATGAGVVLVDSFGELGALWGLADVAFVGGSLDGRRGGQNMIEPAAYGAAVVFGPHTWNFRDIVEQLLACGGAVRVRDGEHLERVVAELFEDAPARQKLGVAARQFVLKQQGATAATLDLLDGLIDERVGRALRASA